MRIIITSQFLLAIGASQVAAFDQSLRGLMGCDDKENFCDCATCDDYTEDPMTGIGSVKVSIDQCTKTSISWMCCAGTNGPNGQCEVLGGVGGNQAGKKESTGLIEVTGIPSGASEIVVQFHDGQNGGPGITGGPSSFCAGNAGGPCNNGLCERTIDLTDCGKTDPPAPSPTPPGMMGDPHVHSWTGEWFDYHGECDLLLMRSLKFDGKQDLDIHVRTKIRFDFSYIEVAALKIGDGILEVSGWGDFAFNGVALTGTDETVPNIGGYQVAHKMVTKKNHVFDVKIGEEQKITISTFKDWVSVKFNGMDEEHFGSVTGLMGSFGGELLARNGTSMHDDPNSLGQDWQVRPEDGQLFRSKRYPQFPSKCVLPDPSEPIHSSTKRRLEETITEEAAQKACDHLKGHAFSFCVHDVVASGDLEVAQAGAF